MRAQCAQSLHRLAFCPCHRNQSTPKSRSCSTETAMASAVAAVSARPVAARPIVAVSAKRSTFFAGSASLSAAPAARTSAAWSPSQRARQAVSVVTARAAKSAAGQQIQVDVEKPLGLVSEWWWWWCWRRAPPAATAACLLLLFKTATTTRIHPLIHTHPPTTVHACMHAVLSAGAGAGQEPQGRPDGEERQRQRRKGAGRRSVACAAPLDGACGSWPAFSSLVALN